MRRLVLAAVAMTACSIDYPNHRPAASAEVRFAPAPRSSRDRSAAADRPGLGTAWGETRSSLVREVSFERASSAPFAQAKIFYDDWEGVGRATSTATSSAEGDDPSSARAGVETTIVDESGEALPIVRADGRVFVVGEEGGRYLLCVRNRTGRRIEVVASVDGLDVMDGRRASLEKRGYLLEPYTSFSIEGFRRNLGQVAAFRFGTVRDSYAFRRGDDRNVGVIGFALFDERQPPSPADDPTGEAERRLDAEPFSTSRFAQPPD
jgi:hypothetical protein